MAQQLSLSTRPRSFDSLVGQDKLVSRIRGHIASGRDIKAWLFVGPPGCGKTTTARILALSLQCEHQTEFGSPCKVCRSNKNTFDIYETNCAKVTGIRDIESELSGSEYGPRLGKYRIYILDEVHRATAQAQGLMLKYLEDSPDTTMFILCTTEAHLLLPTLKRRCMIYRARPLEVDDIEKLVARLLKRIDSDLPADRLAFQLVERGISYPGLIAQAVEKYAAGNDPEEASDVIEGNDVDVKALTRACVKGDWGDAAKYLYSAQPSDVRGIRLGLMSYLRRALLENQEICDRTNAISSAIDQLTGLENASDTVLAAALASAVYRVCQIMVEFKL